MNERYLADRMHRLTGPIIAFREHFLTEILPAFGDIDARADRVGDEAFRKVMSQPAGEDESVDPASVAEAATEFSYDWWTMMTSLRQSMLNLAAAGLYHLVEQQLAVLTRDGMFEESVKDTKLSVVQSWYQNEFSIDFANMPSWAKLDELRMVANTAKHGEGGSARMLREKRPDLFANPAYTALYESEGITTRERIEKVQTTTPMAGEDFFVTPEALSAYAEHVVSFFNELAGVFEERVRR